MSFFTPYSHSENEIEVELNLPNYAAKPDVATAIDTSQFAKKDDLANLNTEFDKLDINKLEKVLI